MDEFKEILKKHLDKCLSKNDYDNARSIIELMKCLESGPTYIPYSSYPIQPYYNPWDFYTTCDSGTNALIAGGN